MKTWFGRLLLLGAVSGGFALGSADAAGTATMLETFDGTGLLPTATAWSQSGGFTNAETGLEWTWTSARARPQIEEENPALALRGSTTPAQRGTLALVQPLTNGIGRVAFTAMLDYSTATNAVLWLDLLADGKVFATCTAPGASNRVPARLEAIPTAAPLTSVGAFCISNRGTTCAIDDLVIEPFRLFVSVEGPEDGDLPLGHETDIRAAVTHAAEDVSFAWSIEPDFAGWANDWNDPYLTLTPTEEDLGKTFTLTARVWETAEPEVLAEAACTLTVSDSMNPRFLDFEGLPTISYDTNSGTIVPMRRVNWRWYNVCTSDRRDAKIGATSARFRHLSSDQPAILESLDPFDGVGAVTLHCACFQSNRTVNFELQVCGDGEEWTAAGGFSSRDCLDITNCVFVVPVERIDPVCIRLVTTGNAGEIADIDDISILPYGESPPMLAADIPSLVTLGSRAEVLFELLHADGMVREWSGTLDPPSEAASFEEMPGGDFLFSFSPVTETDWGEYTLSVETRLPADGTVCRTQGTVRVVSAPRFELAGTSSVEIPGAVDVRVTNVVLHGGNTNAWSTVWEADPPFENEATTANKSRFFIRTGTTDADAGTHALTAVLTDLGTTAAATNTFTILVLSTNTPPPPGETYVIKAYTLTNLSLQADNESPRWFTPFAVASPTSGVGKANWIWRRDSPLESTGPALLEFDLPGCTNPAAVFGVRISAEP
jgi:hypothetical protein